MATDNPFDTTQQPTAQAGTTATGGLVASNMTGGNQYTADAQPANTVSQFDAAQRTVDPATQTVQGQVDSILANDSPLMQRARTLATQQMAQRGLVNSSMAVGAGQAAMMDRALPIATQDAQTYNSVASENMAAKNQTGMFNSGEQNRFSLQTGQQNFTAAQANLDRAQQTAMADKSIDAQKALQTAQQQFTAAQSDLDRVQQTNLQNDSQAFQTSLTQMQQSFTAAQSSLDRQQQAYLQDDLQAFQQMMQNTQIPANFALQISTSTMQSINTIAADPNLSGNVDGKAPEGSSPKSRAISSAIAYANSQLSWANTFYGTNIPQLQTAPTTTAPTTTTFNRLLGGTTTA